MRLGQILVLLVVLALLGGGFLWVAMRFGTDPADESADTHRSLHMGDPLAEPDPPRKIIPAQSRPSPIETPAPRETVATPVAAPAAPSLVPPPRVERIVVRKKSTEKPSVEGLKIPELAASSQHTAELFNSHLMDYLKYGKRSPKWDQTVVDMFWKVTQYWGKMESDAYWEDVYRLGLQAKADGCNDPLVLYYLARTRDIFHGTDDLVRDSFARAAVELRATNYSAARKFYAEMRAAESLAGNYESGLLRKPPQELYALCNPYLIAALESFEDTLHDPDFHNELDLCPLIQSWISMRTLFGNGRLDHYQKFESIIEMTRPKTSFALTVRGMFLIKYAWDARGHGYADKVTPEGWKLFGERIAEARKLFEDALKLDPKNGVAAAEMLTILLAQSADRPEFETAFKRACEADPYSDAPYQAKLTYLQPRWFGSNEILLKFAREALASVQSGKIRNPELAKVVMECHDHVAGEWIDEHPEQLYDNQYWLQPGVWPDIDAAYKAMLKKWPQSREIRTSYAKYAAKCGKWKEAEEMFTALDSEFALSAFKGNMQGYMELRAKIWSALQLPIRPMPLPKY